MRRVEVTQRILRHYREQVQAAPHWHTAPQRHPGLRVSLFFFAILNLLCVWLTLCQPSH